MLHRPLAVLSLFALAASGLATQPAQASSHPVGPRSEKVGTAARAGELTAVLQLAQSPAAAARLQSLARTRLHPSQARARLAGAASLAPAASTRAAAERFATTHGLRVVEGDAWSVTVAGRPDRVAAAFGSRLTSSVVRGRRYTHATVPPAVPAALRGTVAGVVGLDERPAMRAHAGFDGPGSQDGPSLRAAYGVPDAWRGTGVTVATLNLSGWDRNDLADYAQQTGTPTTASTLTEISVAPADARTVDGGGGDFEVALDSETIFATAPAASQRAYFGDNSQTGVTNTMNRIATDAEAGRLQVFSTSWGACEKYYPRSGQDAYSKAVQRMVAAGVTVYAASGDAGAFDCGFADDSGPANDNTTRAVDFPAADPNVIGTGGTTLPTSSTQTETAWSDPRSVGDAPDYQGDGSGGGFSNLKARPAYQQALGLTGTTRAVPDVASDADPATGLAVAYGGRTGRAGGTSLASPTWAGFTAAALSATSRPTVGFGNILPTLYANPSAFRDITTGDNHAFAAGTGYDQVTGLGVPRWIALGPLLAGSPSLTVTRPYTRSTTVAVTVRPPSGSTFTGYRLGEGAAFATCDGIPPSGSSTPPTSVVLASATQGRHTLTLDAVDSNGTCHITQAVVTYDTVAPVAQLTFGLATGTDTRARVRWSATDASSPVPSYDVVVARRGSVTDYVANGTGGTQRTTGALVLGGTYLSTVRARDAAGNVSPTVQLTSVVPYDDRSVSVAGPWVRSPLSSDFLGSHLRSATRGASATFRRTGRSYTIGILRTPSAGFVDVYVDGVRTGYDLYAAKTQVRQQVLVRRFTSSGLHTVKVVVRGGHRAASAGSNVYLDSFTVAP